MTGSQEKLLVSPRESREALSAERGSSCLVVHQISALLQRIHDVRSLWILV